MDVGLFVTKTHTPSMITSIVPQTVLKVTLGTKKKSDIMRKVVQTTKIQNEVGW